MNVILNLKNMRITCVRLGYVKKFMLNLEKKTSNLFLIKILIILINNIL